MKSLRFRTDHCPAPAGIDLFDLFHGSGRDPSSRAIEAMKLVKISDGMM